VKNSRLVFTAAVILTVSSAALWITERNAQAQQAQGPSAQTAGGRGAVAGVRDPFAGADFSPQPPVLPLSPAEEQKKFILYPGFHLEPVLTDPDIEEPMEIAFDGNGRMFVLEMRSYMQDKDAKGELDPISRISLHTDTKGTGVYDKHTIFVDHLVVPRFVMPFGPNAILVMESNTDEVYKYTDTNGDGVADKKEFFTGDFGRAGNIEHQPGALFNAMDNWLYSTVNAVRLRWKPNGTVIRENTGSNGAQWGAAQDNYGKTYFTAGASGVPSAVQFPIVYGNFNPPDQLEPGLNEVWGAPVKIADMQGGMGAVRMPDGSLNAATAGAGGMIYRGDRLPADMLGDYFYGEVVGRIVRRIRPVNTEGLTQMRNVYQAEKSEFIRSTDPLFRPVFQVNAPDGTMYIADCYRGIVQEYQWSGPGTYLRRRVDQYQLDKVVRHGRIWRLTYDGMARDKTMPHMNDETAAQLVAHLSHPNGWWRDTAQQLLVLKQDKSAVPALKDLAKSSGNQLARIHALWTLEGLNSLDAVTVRQFLADADPKIRMTGLRVSESLYKGGDHSFEADWRAATKDKDTDVAIQGLLTAHLMGIEGMPELIQGAEDASKARGIKFVGDTFLNPNPNGGGFFGASLPRQQSPETKELMTRGKAVYEELCYTCHGDDGRGAPVEAGKGKAGTTKAPPLAGSPRVTGHRDYIIKAVMYGLNGPIDGKTYTEQMVPNGGNKDIWVAAVANYVRNSFGNNAGFVTVEDVARVRAANPGRVVTQAREEAGAPKTRFAIPQLLASLPRTMTPQSSWKATASVNPDDAAGGFSLARWSTGTSQKPGMWYQVELPQATTFTEIQFDSPRAGESGGKGNPAPNGPGTAAFGALGGSGAAGRAGGRGRGVAAPPAPLGVPVAYKVEISLDGSAWTSVAEGKGESDTTNIVLKPTKAKFIRITQTGDDPKAPGWNMERFRLYGPSPVVTASAAKPGAKPGAPVSK
jgi:mono/diheme cytochrome c family protein